MSTVMNVIQLMGGVILSMGYIPQILRIVKTQSVEDFSGKTLVMVLVGVSCMEVYAVYNFLIGHAAMFFITNTVSTIMALLMLLLYVKYRK